MVKVLSFFPRVARIFWTVPILINLFIDPAPCQAKRGREKERSNKRRIQIDAMSYYATGNFFQICFIVSRYLRTWILRAMNFVWTNKQDKKWTQSLSIISSPNSESKSLLLHLCKRDKNAHVLFYMLWKCNKPTNKGKKNRRLGVNWNSNKKKPKLEF